MVELLRQQGYIVDPEKIEDSVNAMIEAFVKELKIEGNIACHSLRKSFGYYAWKFLNVSSNLLMSIFNHSTFEVTKNYLGIDQDEKDEVYLRVIA